MGPKVQTIHKVAKVKNNQVIIELPPEFAGHEVEVILKSLTHKDSLISAIEKEIDVGIRSPLTVRKHNEIFDNLRTKYASR